MTTHRFRGYEVMMDLMGMQADMMDALVVRYCYVLDVDACGFGFFHLVGWSVTGRFLVRRNNFERLLRRW